MNLIFNIRNGSHCLLCQASSDIINVLKTGSVRPSASHSSDLVWSIGPALDWTEVGLLEPTVQQVNRTNWPIQLNFFFFKIASKLLRFGVYITTSLQLQTLPPTPALAAGLSLYPPPTRRSLQHLDNSHRRWKPPCPPFFHSFLLIVLLFAGHH